MKFTLTASVSPVGASSRIVIEIHHDRITESNLRDGTMRQGCEFYVADLVNEYTRLVSKIDFSPKTINNRPIHRRSPMLVAGPDDDGYCKVVSVSGSTCSMDFDGERRTSSDFGSLLVDALRGWD
jgi:hypothetical protein